MIRKIIKIDEEKCDGCGVCVPECHEGALQIIDGKARLISDLFCDGLGACIGHCPQEAISIEERETEPYNEFKVMETIVRGGPNVIKAHLNHLKDHNEMEFYNQALEYLEVAGISVDLTSETNAHSGCGCPGSASRVIDRTATGTKEQIRIESELRQWPVQFHLVSPHAGYYRNSDLLIAADCVPFAYPNFHSDFMRGKSLAIACPKLDSNKQIYLDKLITMITDSNLKSITVLVMEVPCCSGLVQLAKQAIEFSGAEIPLYVKVIGIEGSIINELILN